MFPSPLSSRRLCIQHPWCCYSVHGTHIDRMIHLAPFISNYMSCYRYYTEIPCATHLASLPLFDPVLMSNKDFLAICNGYYRCSSGFGQSFDPFCTPLHLANHTYYRTFRSKWYVNAWKLPTTCTGPNCPVCPLSPRHTAQPTTEMAVAALTVHRGRGQPPFGAFARKEHEYGAKRVVA